MGYKPKFTLHTFVITATGAHKTQRRQVLRNGVAVIATITITVTAILGSHVNISGVNE